MNSQWKMVPVEPTAEMIEALAAEIFPDDNLAGKALQRLRGCDVVFPKYEIESAVGKYSRVLAAAPVPPAGDVEILRNRLEAARARFSRWNGRLLESLREERLTTARLTAERDGLLAEVERLKNLPHGQILAESAGRHLLNSGAENFVGDVFTIEADDGTTKFEIVVTTQKVDAKSPGEVCSELQSELTKARELLPEMRRQFERANFVQLGKLINEALAHQSAPAAKGGE